MPICRNPLCAKDKPSDEFYNNPRAISGKMGRCKVCVQAYQTQWRHTHPEQNRRSRQESKKRNKGKISEESKRYYQKNKEKISILRKQRYQRSKVRVLAQCREYRLKNRDRISLRAKTYRLSHQVQLLAYRLKRKPQKQEYMRRWTEKNRMSHRTKSREYRLAHLEAARQRERAYAQSHRSEKYAYSKQWRKKHPDYWYGYVSRRRARMRTTQIESIKRSDIIRRDRARCHICGKKVAKQHLSLDHLIPLHAHGPHIAENLAVAHLSCNIKRNHVNTPVQLRLLP